MVSKKFIGVFALLLCAGFFASAQDFKKHIIKANLTISPGFMLEQKLTNLYLHGHLEYFPEEKVSLRGEGYLYLDSQQEQEIFSVNHALLFGGFYHLLQGKADPFVGFQPGLSFSKAADAEAGERTAVVPLLSITAGMNYFVGKYFNFFVSARYLKGRLHSAASPFAVDEIRLSAGLGFNLHLKQ